MVAYTLEQRWEILRHYFENYHNKKIIFSDEAHFDLRGYVKSNCRIWGTENPHVRRIQNESLFGADFGPEA